MDAIFAREVALKYNFCGKKGKSSFEKEFSFIHTIIG